MYENNCECCNSDIYRLHELVQHGPPTNVHDEYLICLSEVVSKGREGLIGF